jgi:hypothetical protein
MSTGLAFATTSAATSSPTTTARAAGFALGAFFRRVYIATRFQIRCGAFSR